MMVRQFSKRKVGMTILNGLLALTLVFGAFGTANAQEAGKQIMLPLVQVGSSNSQPVDGSFADYYELLALMGLESDSSDVTIVDGAAVADSTARVHAAGSCYWGNGSGRTNWSQPGWLGVVIERQDEPNTSSCRDINLHVEVKHPEAAGCNIVTKVVANGWVVTKKGAPKNQWFVPLYGLSTSWDGLVWTSPACGAARLFWAS